MVDQHEPGPTQPDQDHTVNAISQTAVPPVIGSYVIGNRMATGGMGDIYHAEHPQLRMPVAVKVMKVSFRDPADVRRFEHEYQSLARMQHPGIARVFDAGTYEVNGEIRPYFVMEYIPGSKTLTGYAETNNLTINDRLRLFIEICRAVDHANDRGVIHRDLKPSNILVDADGRVRLIDFGVAADLAAPDSIGRPGQRLGTYAYMPPEMIDADPLAIDRRSDVYTLGVVLFELLTGSLPYPVRDKPPYEVARLICQEPPDHLEEYDRTLPKELDDIIQRALKKERRGRYDSAGKFAQDVERFVEHTTVDDGSGAFSPSARHPGWRGWVSDQYIAALSACAVLTMVFVFVVVAFTVYRATFVGQWYEGALMSQVTPRAMAANPAAPVVSMFGRMPIEMAGAANDLGVTGASLTDNKSWRRIYAALLDALREADAAVVVFDIRFVGTHDEYDAPLAEAMKRAREAKLPVIVGTRVWDHTSDPEIVCSPNLSPYVFIGGTTGIYTRDVQWFTDLAVFPVDHRRARPSIGVLAYAAYQYPEAIVDLELDELTGQLGLSYYRNTETPGLRDYIAPTEWLVSSLLVREGEKDTEYRIPKGAITVRRFLHLPDDETLTQNTVYIRDFTAMTAADRRKAVGGRIVVIGIPLPDDVHFVNSERMVAGAQIQATAIAELLNQLPVRVTRPLENIIT
ncbi:MAG: protein kinase, partial [Phycisphaerales bacterium]|nr:protein kinase [Phycisphaerales bacterium]